MKPELKRVIWIIVGILVLFFAAELALVFFISRSTDARISSNLYKIAHPGQLFQEALNIAINPSLVATTTTSTATTTPNQPVPGSCLILQEQYCDTGKIVKYDKSTYVALSLPVGAVVFSPTDNTLTFTGFLGSNPAHPVAKDVEIASFASMVGANLMTSKTAAVIVAGDGLLPGLTSGWDKSGNITNTHPYAKGDVVATLKSDDKISGLGDVNVLLAFGGSGGTINALFASEAKKVQSGNETVEQLLQNMVEAELTNK